jgi:hypothetical protein
MHSRDAFKSLCSINKPTATQKKYADKDRRDAEVFAPGDFVWLARRNIKTSRPSLKLDYKRVGPFEIKERIVMNAYRLKLPADCKIHDVFNVSLLDKARSEHVTESEGIPVLLDNGQTEFWAKRIVDSKLKRSRLFYLVEWHTTGSDERTWEPIENMTNATELVKDFHKRYPEKPGGGLYTRV